MTREQDRAVDKPSSTEHKHPAPCAGAAELAAEAARSLDLLLELAQPEAGDIVVVGCSTSEIQGSRIGSAGSPELAAHLVRDLNAVGRRYGVSLAIQCCEHLNRALVVERRTMRDHRLTQVTVYPVWNAGGSLAAAAMDGFDDAVVVEAVAAVAGMDIGHTLIGMHLRPVAVPVRLPWKHIGSADLVLARTRPRLIGGARASYSRESTAGLSSSLASDAKETCR
jgi:uncharacterized protein (TIGR01440 family)